MIFIDNEIYLNNFISCYRKTKQKTKKKKKLNGENAIKNKTGKMRWGRNFKRTRRKLSKRRYTSLFQFLDKATGKRKRTKKLSDDRSYKFPHLIIFFNVHGILRFQKILQKCGTAFFANVHLNAKVTSIGGFGTLYLPRQIFYFSFQLRLLVLKLAKNTLH